MKKIPLICTFILLSMSLLTLTGQSIAAESSVQIPRVPFPEKQVADLDALKWRFIGPMMGNRGSDVVGHPTEKSVFFHAASNGLWKTTDAGATWFACR